MGDQCQGRGVPECWTQLAVGGAALPAVDRTETLPRRVGMMPWESSSPLRCGPPHACIKRQSLLWG